MSKHNRERRAFAAQNLMNARHPLIVPPLTDSQKARLRKKAKRGKVKPPVTTPGPDGVALAIEAAGISRTSVGVGKRDGKILMRRAVHGKQ